MAFAGRLFRSSPPLLRFRTGGATTLLPQPPPNSQYEKISLCLSLGSLNNESSVVSQESAKKKDQETINSNSTSSCFKQFGFAMENNSNNHDLVLRLGMGFDPENSKKAAAATKDGLLGVLEEDSCKLSICHNIVKKETINVIKKKKRKRANSELEDSNMKKRAMLFQDDSSNSNDLNMKKTLTKSDIDHSSRLLLGNKGIVDQILPNSEECNQIAKEGKEIKVYDLELKKESNLILKQWKTNSFILNHGWTENFVKARKLVEGDEIKLTWDQASTRLNFSVVYRVFL